MSLCDYGNFGRHDGTNCRFGNYSQVSTEIHDSLLHSGKSQSLALDTGGIETNAVVLDDYGYCAAGVPYGDVDCAGPRVPRAIGESFLHDPIDADSMLLRQRVT